MSPQSTISSLPPSPKSSGPFPNTTLSQQPVGARSAPPMAKVGSTGDPALAKRRARNLLRDYYGLAGSSGPSSPSGSEPGGAGTGQKPSGQAKTRAAQEQEALSIDSPYFDADAYFKKLVRDSSLKSLLATANGLISDIRELDGERQSLVYNHHHELVEASETIGKMKSSSEKLDGTLVQLQDSFSAISELATTLCGARPPNIKLTSDAKTDSDSRGKKDIEAGLHLSALLSLPTILRGLLTSENRGAADQLWGQWEPALRSFEEAGVEGAKQIGNECRDVLRTASKSHSPLERTDFS